MDIPRLARKPTKQGYNMFLTNRQKVKRYDKYERQRKDITRLRTEIEVLQKDLDERIAKLKTMQEKLKEMLEELLGRKQ